MRFPIEFRRFWSELSSHERKFGLVRFRSLLGIVVSVNYSRLGCGEIIVCAGMGEGLEQAESMVKFQLL